MIILTERQVARVRNHLAQAGLNDDLSTELLDHLCCAIEARMTAGEEFEDARVLILKNWPVQQMRDLQKDIHFTTKTKPMLYRISAIIALLAGIALLSPLPRFAGANQEVTHAPRTPEFAPDAARFDPPKASPIAGMDIKTDISAGFGMRKHPFFGDQRLHRGVDLISKSGTPVLATADGKVVYAGEDGKYGIVVRILHDDGYVTLYGHLSHHSVDRGDQVVLGQEIAAVGTTGASTGPHLHYEVLKDDIPVDPLTFLD